MATCASSWLLLILIILMAGACVIGWIMYADAIKKKVCPDCGAPVIPPVVPPK